MTSRMSSDYSMPVHLDSAKRKGPPSGKRRCTAADHRSEVSQAAQLDDLFEPHGQHEVSVKGKGEQVAEHEMLGYQIG